MQRALVTGATGFIGGHLTETLVRQGVEVRCLVRPTSNTKTLTDLGVTFIEGDVTDPFGLEEAVNGVDVVFHLAGMITSLSKRDMWRANCDGPSNVAAACKAADKTPVMILLSSVAAAGPAEESVALCETMPPDPVSNYGRSKLAGEESVLTFAGEVPITMIRPGIIFGPRDQLTLPIFKTIATWGLHPVVGLGKTKISLLHVEDMVNLLILAATQGERLPSSHDANEHGTGIYFVADEAAPTYHELGKLIARAMERRVIPLPSLAASAWSAAAVSQLWSQLIRRTTPFNLDKIREATQVSWAIDSSKAKQQLNWSPACSLDQRLRQTVEWYVDNDWIKVRRLFGRPS